MIPAADPPRRLFKPLNMLVLHFRPRRVAEKTLSFKLTWGLGGPRIGPATLRSFFAMHTAVFTALIVRKYHPSRLESVQAVFVFLAVGWVISRVHYNLGLLYDYLGKTRQAETALRRAVELEPDNMDYLQTLARQYLKRGNFAEADRIADQMIARHPGDSRGPELKGFVQRK